MRQGKVFFHPIEGAGQLSISWSGRSKGDAIEAKKGAGVGFFSAQGELLSVLFDEVQALEDRQVLEFANYRVEVSVKNGIVSHKVIRFVPKALPKKGAPRKRLKRPHKSR